MPRRPPHGGRFNETVVACNTARVCVCACDQEGESQRECLSVYFSLLLGIVLQNFQQPLVTGPPALGLPTRAIICPGLCLLARDGDRRAAEMLIKPLHHPQLARRRGQERAGVSITG